jgi:hypothetical protein
MILRVRSRFPQFTARASVQTCEYGQHDYDLFTNGQLFIRHYHGDAASVADLRPLVQMFNYDTAIVLGTMAVGVKQTARMQV